MKIAFAKPQMPNSGAAIVGVYEDKKLSPSAQALDKKTRGAVSRAIAASRFEGKKDQSLSLLAPAGVKLSRILLLGLGKAGETDALALEGLGGAIAAQLASNGDKEATLMLDKGMEGKLAPAAAAAHIAQGAQLRAYRFDKYQTKEKEKREKEKKPGLEILHIALDDVAGARKHFGPLEKVAEGVAFTRDLVSEPSNVIYPESLAKQAAGLKALGVKVEILGEKEMKKLGMNVLLSVGQGSVRESQLVVMSWQGAKDKKAPPLALVGKGVTFDTGGISIKPAAGMEEMKYDMGGAGAVIGAMKALAGRRAKANVVGVVGLVENMPSGNAQRPGDVWTSMSGQTVEVINTDAEGRLVLCDAMWYTQTRFKPKAMIDLATLTGAILIALGTEYAGLFSNDDDLARQVAEAGKAVGEPVWRMPMGEAYDKMLKSDIADMKNIGGRDAGSITAAQFLKRFVKDTPWAHIDIAGMAWAKKDMPVVPKGASGYGVRLLDRLVADHYEA